MKKEIVIKEKQLPANIKDLQQFILVTTEALKLYKTKLAVVNKLDISKAVRDQTLQDGQKVGTALLYAETKLGELIRELPKKGKTKEYGSTGGTIPTLPEGITKKQSHISQQLAGHKELVEKTIKEAKENEDIPTKIEVLRKIKEEERERKRNKTNAQPLPAKKFKVIYADPPWQYDVDLSSGATRSPETNYSVMDLESLKTFGEKVKELSYKDCILFMWITAPKLNWMNDVLEAWGFTYKTNLIWDKIKPNMGHYSSVRHEILIIAGKGNCSPTCDGKTIQSIDSVQAIEKSSKHSEKPIEFRKIIEKLYPDCKKIELFARGIPPDGWIFWGNQVDANE